MATIPCVCPPKADGTPRHDSDEVTLHERLSFRTALAVRNVIRLREDDEGTEEILAALTEQYLIHGIASWTLQDARGKPVEVNRASIATFLEEHPLEAFVVGDEADDLYSEAVVLPLLGRASTSSPPLPTNGSTSAQTASPTKPRKPSRPSSTSTSRMDATGTTPSPLAGGYSS